MSHVRTAVLVLLIGSATANAQPMNHTASPVTQGTAAAKSPADTAFADAMDAMMRDMHQGMPTGDTDADFVRLMVPHHQSAVDMAKAELQYGRDAELKALAASIIADQEREIALMKAWQARQAK